MKFELVIPCYNEEKNIPSLVNKAVDSAKNYRFRPDEFQLVLVENGSTDRSAVILSELAQTEVGCWFRVVKVPKNQGYGHGIWAGLTDTSAEYIGWTHADLQCDPADAFRALRIVQGDKSKKSLAKGVRKGRGLVDRVVSLGFDFFARLLLGSKFSEVNAQPKVFHRRLLSHVNAPPNSMEFDLFILYSALKNHYKIRTLEVHFPPRAHGVSNFGPTVLTKCKTIFKSLIYMNHTRKAHGRI